MIIDAFCHVLPRPYYDRLQEIQTAGAANLLKRTAPIASLYDMDERERVLEPFGDDYRQIISLAAPQIEALGRPDVTIDLARIANDAMAELVGAGEGRYAGFVAGLPLNDVDASLAEIDRAVNDLGALGIQIYTHVNGRAWDEPDLAPVFARMAELDRPIWVHPSRNSSWPDYPLSEDKSRFEIWWTLGWPYDTSVFMARLAFSGVFERHPGLRVITHHAGGMIPFFSGRVGPGWDQLGARTPDAEADLVDSKLTGRPIDTFHKFYADTAVFGAPHALQCAYEFFGADQMLFASDMPFDPVQGRFIRATIDDVNALRCTEDERVQIFEGNARRLLRGSL